MNTKLEAAMGSGAWSGGRRRRIGLLLARPDVEIDGDFLRGVTAAAAAMDMDVLCFSGGHLNTRTPAWDLFDLAAEVDLDGVIIGTAMGHLVPEEELRAFCVPYTRVPVVTGALGLIEFPSIAADNFTGLYDLVSHLIETHGCERIAYIEGPAGQPEASVRFQAYRAALEDHGIVFDAERVVPGNYILESGTAAMLILLERFWSEQSGLALDAVVAANDPMAVGAHQALIAKGLQVPGRSQRGDRDARGQGVALVGFDDAEMGRNLMPPLSTVRQSFAAMGQRAASILARLMEGETITGLITVPSEVVLRRSCGCAPAAVARAASLGEMQPGEHRADTEPAAPAELALWRALWHDVGLDAREFATSGTFLVTVEAQLNELYSAWGDPDEVHDRLSDLRRRLVAGTDASDRESVALSLAQLGRAEDLLHQARVLIGEVGRKIETARAAADEREADLLRDFDTAISSVIDLEGLAQVVAAFLPRWNMRELYLVRQDTRLWSPANGSSSGDRRRYVRDGHLVLAYRDGTVDLVDSAFASPDLLPDRVDDLVSPALVIMPLQFRGRLFGYTLMSYAGDDATVLQGRSQVARNFIYRRIAEDLSSVLYRAQLLSDAEQARLQAEASLAEIRQTREIADRVQRAPDAESILRVALEEISQVLGAPRAIARLGVSTTPVSADEMADHSGNEHRREGR